MFGGGLILILVICDFISSEH